MLGSVGLVAIGAVIAVGRGASGASQPAAAALPAAPRPIAISTPRPAATASRYAAVLRRATARAGPRSSAPGVGVVGRRTPEGTTNIVTIAGRSRALGGQVWVPVRLAGLRGRTGWLPRPALGGYTSVRGVLTIDRRRLRATLRRDGRTVFSAPVGIGRPTAPTPGGDFYVRDRLTRYRDPTYGPLAFGTSAKAPGVTDWPAGGFVGIHGTNRPDLIPGRVSHGCIRLRNRDILRLGRLMAVGTPVRVV